MEFGSVGVPVRRCAGARQPAAGDADAVGAVLAAPGEDADQGPVDVAARVPGAGLDLLHRYLVPAADDASHGDGDDDFRTFFSGTWEPLPPLGLGRVRPEALGHPPLRGPDMKRPPARTTWSEGVCAPGRTRTCGQALRRRLLYPLSYGGRVWWPLSWVPGCGPVRDVAGDKDRAPSTLSLLLRLRDVMWRFSEAVLIIAGRYESCIAFGASRTGCCALVMPGLRPRPSHPFRPLCPVGAQTCSYASEFP